MEAFLATVKKVYLSEDDFKELDTQNDFVKYYNNNKNFLGKDSRFLGAIEFARDNSYKLENYAFPFDKNNMTFPIVGETVFIIINNREYFWMPFSNNQYPNYREDYKISEASKDKEKEKVKYLKPKEGDTIISGRVGNTIRFSEFFLSADNKTSSPSIFIRNKQNPEFDNKKIGELVEEDINKDGTSVYITSGKVKIPFKETIKKQKVGFKNYPNSKDLDGDQLFINSDRVLLSAKAYEFIIYGKTNTGIITDGNFSVDAEKEVYIHSNNKITIHSAGNNQIFLNSENGKVYLGKNKGEGNDGADVQKMVLGGELVAIMKELIDAINQQQYLTPSGPSATGPVNRATFTSIKNKLNKLLSSTNFLSK